MYRGGKELRAGIVALLVFFVANGIAFADVYNDSIYSSNRSLTLTVEQSINGVGFYSDHEYVRMPNVLEPAGVNSNGVQAKISAHGSGRISSESRLSAVSTNITIGADDHAELMDHREATSSIRSEEDKRITYSPAATDIGSGFYSLHPVKFNSLLKESNWIKNRGGLNSMHNEIEYAHGIDKKLVALVTAFESEEDPSTTSMNFSENVKAGRSHIGVLQADVNAMEENITGATGEEAEGLGFAKSAWSKPLVQVDEDYVGTFHIEKRMSLATLLNVDDESDSDEWLPCGCHAGWSDMNPHDQWGHSADSIFDCYCGEGTR